MIKASCSYLLSVYEKFFNIILKAGIYPNTWCEGLLTLIIKSGDKSDPGNYRRICVSSCLEKFFSSIINQRLVDFLEKKKILHPSQIGFLKDNRTADHIFILRTLIEKYSYHHNQKIMPALLILRRHLILFGRKAFLTVSFKSYGIGRWEYLFIN